MNASSKVILESPLVVPDVVDIYRRIILAVPDMNELVHLALLEAQYLGTSQGKSAMVAVGEFCEHLNPDVLREYASLTNMDISTVRSLFEHDILNFVTIVSKFYRSQIKFKGISKYLLDNSKYLMLEQIVDTANKPPHIIATIKDLTYVQLSRSNNPDRLSFKDDLADFP